MLEAVLALVFLSINDGNEQDARPARPEAEPGDVEPTLDQIFQPPRVLGVRPRRHQLSADGAFVTFEWAPVDEEKRKFHTYVVESDGGEPRVLFDAGEKARTWWTRHDAELLVHRNGWLELHDLHGGFAPRPLMEVGERLNDLTLLEQTNAVAFQTGDDARLWLLDLATGARFAPADHLKDRGRWFAILEEVDKFAIFAAPSASGDEEKTTASDKSKKDEPQKRVLHVCPISPQDGFDYETSFEEGGTVTVSADGLYALRRRTSPSVNRKLIMADYLTDQVSTVNVRSSLPGDKASKVELELHAVEDNAPIPVPLDAGVHYWSTRAHWSDTGHSLLLERLSNDFHVRQILSVDPETRSSRLLFAERDDAWIGGPLLWSDWAEVGGVLFTSERTGFNQLYHLSEAGELRCLTGEESRSEVRGVVPLHDRDELVILTNEPDPAERHLFHLDLTTADRRQITSGAGVAGRPVASRDGSRVAWLQSFLGVPAELHAAPIDEAAEPVRLTDSTPDAYAKLDMPPPEIIEYPSGEGDDQVMVRAYLYRPVPFDPDAKYPAVMFIHGAGYLQNVTRSMSSYDVNMLFHHRLTRKGYVVIDPDYRHSDGYGRDFRADIHRHMGGKDLDDAVAGVEYMKTLGYVDTDRVGIYGGSYGGFMTLMALFTKPDVFAAGCALRSVTDWRTYNAWYTNARLGDPKEDAESYEKSSPIDHAEHLSKPLLLLHGLKDSNVFAQDTIRLIEKLIELGKDFDAMLYPSQNHGFTDPDSWVDEYKRIERFFDRHLKGE